MQRALGNFLLVKLVLVPVLVILIDSSGIVVSNERLKVYYRIFKTKTREGKTKISNKQIMEGVL